MPMRPGATAHAGVPITAQKRCQILQEALRWFNWPWGSVRSSLLGNSSRTPPWRWQQGCRRQRLYSALHRLYNDRYDALGWRRGHSPHLLWLLELQDPPGTPSSAYQCRTAMGNRRLSPWAMQQTRQRA